MENDNDRLAFYKCSQPKHEISTASKKHTNYSVAILPVIPPTFTPTSLQNCSGSAAATSHIALTFTSSLRRCRIAHYVLPQEQQQHLKQGEEHPCISEQGCVDEGKLAAEQGPFLRRLEGVQEDGIDIV